MSELSIWVVVGLFFGVLAGMPATILLMASAAEPRAMPKRQWDEDEPRPQVAVFPDETWRVVEPGPRLLTVDEEAQPWGGGL